MTTVALSSLSLFPANKDQTQETRKRGFAAWGQGMTLEQYLERDARSDDHEVGKDRGWVTWVLAHRDSPESLDFLCSCETFRREGLVARASGEEGAKNITEVNCYGIASVFTPEKNRGKGYARHMMRLLHWIIGQRGFLPLDCFPTEWGSPPERPSFIKDGEFSVLYSDIGPRFYYLAGPILDKGDGWRPTEPTSTIWNTGSAYALLSSASSGFLDWRWLDNESIEEAWKADAHEIKNELSIEPTSHPIAFTFLPTRGIAEFQHHRLEPFWRRMDATPTYWGVCPNTSDPSIFNISNFASWTLDFRPPVMNRLVVTRLRTALEHFEGLLFQILDFAKRHSVDEVEIWNLPSELGDAAQQSGGRTSPREEHLPAFKWYGLGDSKDVSWAYNEKFCWC